MRKKLFRGVACNITFVVITAALCSLMIFTFTMSCYAAAEFNWTGYYNVNGPGVIYCVVENGDMSLDDAYNLMIKPAASESDCQLILTWYPQLKDRMIADGKIPGDATPPPASEPTQPAQPSEKPKEEFTVTDMDKWMVTIQQVNVRDGATQNYDKLGTLAQDTQVHVTGLASTGWYRIEYKGQSGYVSDKYLGEIVLEPISEIPSEEPISEGPKSEEPKSEEVSEVPSIEDTETPTTSEPKSEVEESEEPQSSEAASEEKPSETESEASEPKEENSQTPASEETETSEEVMSPQAETATSFWLYAIIIGVVIVAGVIIIVLVVRNNKKK